MGLELLTPFSFNQFRDECNIFLILSYNIREASLKPIQVHNFLLHVFILKDKQGKHIRGFVIIEMFGLKQTERDCL